MSERTTDPIYRSATAPSETASEGICALLAASRKRSQTVQLMPEGEGMRFEVIDVPSGAFLLIAHVSRYGDLSFEWSVGDA